MRRGASRITISSSRRRSIRRLHRPSRLYAPIGKLLPGIGSVKMSDGPQAPHLLAFSPKQPRDPPPRQVAQSDGRRRLLLALRFVPGEGREGLPPDGWVEPSFLSRPAGPRFPVSFRPTAGVVRRA